jgi:hypothetical protein
LVTTILFGKELYGHGMGPDVLIMVVEEVDPVLGALGFTGAIATIGPGDSGCAQLNEKGCVVRVYCPGGGA